MTDKDRVEPPLAARSRKSGRNSASGSVVPLNEKGSRTFLYAPLAGDPPLPLLDVRSAQGFEHGHVPGAVNIPIQELRARMSELPPKGSEIRLRIHADLRSCRLDVIDAGVGIPRKDLKNIFKMFWRSGEAQSRIPRGTGLGLYIVRNVVSDHKGKVWATSAGPGRGSTFSVRLPRVRDYWNMRARKNLRAAPADRV